MMRLLAAAATVLATGCSLIYDVDDLRGRDAGPAPDATPIDLHQIARFQQISGNNELALRIFRMNAKRFPNQWPVNVGMARAAALSGDNRSAVEYAKKALAQAPDDMNKKNLEGLIQQWSAPAAAAASNK